MPSASTAAVNYSSCTGTGAPHRHGLGPAGRDRLAQRRFGPAQRIVERQPRQLERALAAPVDPSLPLVWFPFAQNVVFARMIERGEWTGRIVAPAAGRSAPLGERTERTVILEDLSDAHLQLIMDRRGRLFDRSTTFVYERV
ncbi:MAG: hypothetical protein OHK0044_17820 [Burkholderiaceae bacterium]